MSQGLKIFIYILSAFPSTNLVGLILGIIWMNDKEDMEKKQVGKTALIIAISSFVITCICYLILFVFSAAAGGSGY